MDAAGVKSIDVYSQLLARQKMEFAQHVMEEI
jgi:hypothetical protein